MNFFRPDTTLSEDVGASFTLNTTTLVPTVAYVISGSRSNVSPAGVSLPDHVLPVVLHARKHEVGDVGHPVLRNHRVAKLALGGKTSVLTVVCMEDDARAANVLGCATTFVGSTATPLNEIPAATPNDWQCLLFRNRDAITLHVAGLVYTPTPGFTVSLAPAAAERQGHDPNALVLELSLKPSAGKSPSVVTPHTVQFQKTLRDAARITAVTVMAPDGDATRIAVISAA